MPSYWMVTVPDDEPCMQGRSFVEAHTDKSLLKNHMARLDGKAYYMAPGSTELMEEGPAFAFENQVPGTTRFQYTGPVTFQGGKLATQAFKDAATGKEYPTIEALTEAIEKRVSEAAMPPVPAPAGQRRVATL